MEQNINIELDELNREIVYPSNYTEGNHITLYLGKCEDFLNSLPDNSIQLIITSPPYNIGKAYEKIMPFEDYLSWQDHIIDLCVRKLKPTGSICWQVGNTIDKRTNEKLPLDIYLFNSFKSRNLLFKNRIIWQFGHGANDKNRFSGRYETILWFSKSDTCVFNLDLVRVPQKYPGKKAYKGKKAGQYSSNPLGKNPSDVWDIPNVKSNHVEKTIHPCQFPVALAQRLILSLSNENDLVYDPFMGVGTTQVAAILNNRKTAGSEANAEYFRIATNRLHDARQGIIKIRDDKPVYQPPPNTPLTQNPFNK